MDVTLSHSFILFVSIPRIFPEGTSFGRLKYSVSTKSKLFGCVKTRLVTSSVVTAINFTFKPVSSNNFFCTSSPILTAVPKYLKVIGSEEITLGAYKAATAAAVVPVPNLSIFLLEIDDEFLGFIFSSVVKNL